MPNPPLPSPPVPPAGPRPDDPAPWAVGASEYLFRKPWLTLRQDAVTLPGGGQVPEYWVFEYPPWVNVIATTAAQEIILVRQYRHGTKTVHYELPAGTCESDGEDLLAAAQRELLEETGYGGGKWSPFLTVAANPAIQSNLTHTFLAENVKRLQPPGTEATEELTVHRVKLSDLGRLVRTGGFLQALHLAPIYKYLWERGMALAKNSM